MPNMPATNDRKSTTSFQVFLDGNLMESKVRTHRKPFLYHLARASSSPWLQAAQKGCWFDMPGTRSQEATARQTQLSSKRDDSAARHWESETSRCLAVVDSTEREDHHSGRYIFPQSSTAQILARRIWQRSA